MAHCTEITINSDAYRLSGQLFHPKLQTPAIACVIHGATGVPRAYYVDFARWVADRQGAACLIYDYRDTDLEPAELRSSKTTMAD